MIVAIMQRYLIEHISDEMDSIKLSKRGTEDEREYCVGRSEMARPPFYEIITATADRVRQGAGYDCFGLSLVVRYLLTVNSTA